MDCQTVNSPRLKRFSRFLMGCIELCEPPRWPQHGKPHDFGLGIAVEQACHGENVHGQSEWHTFGHHPRIGNANAWGSP